MQISVSSILIYNEMYSPQQIQIKFGKKSWTKKNNFHFYEWNFLWEIIGFIRFVLVHWQENWILLLAIPTLILRLSNQIFQAYNWMFWKATLEFIVCFVVGKSVWNMTQKNQMIVIIVIVFAEQLHVTKSKNFNKWFLNEYYGSIQTQSMANMISSVNDLFKYLMNKKSFVWWYQSSEWNRKWFPI